MYILPRTFIKRCTIVLIHVDGVNLLWENKPRDVCRNRQEWGARLWRGSHTRRPREESPWTGLSTSHEPDVGRDVGFRSVIDEGTRRDLSRKMYPTHVPFGLLGA